MRSSFILTETQVLACGANRNQELVLDPIKKTLPCFTPIENLSNVIDVQCG